MVRSLGVQLEHLNRTSLARSLEEQLALKQGLLGKVPGGIAGALEQDLLGEVLNIQLEHLNRIF